jgi:hypothetical protein
MEKRRNRYKRPPPVGLFTASDFDICKLLSPGTNVRSPWGYKYLPSGYFPLLLNRSDKHCPRRVSQLRGSPVYTELAQQPENYYQQFIFQLGTGGVKELHIAGGVV